jgi:hypothetical protein
MVDNDAICPVCGYALEEPAWTADGGGSQEICPSCGIQFGYTDAAGGDPGRRAALWQEWRGRWIAEGKPWRGVGTPPHDFDPDAQLARLH